MQKMGLNEIRGKFLKFFEEKGHLVQPSFPLVPHNDNSLLLINAGMAPLKNYFTGVETPPSSRMTTCQKCIRTGDIENVGVTARHATLFEMLGNFSFGDYFKEQTLEWGYEFVTKHLNMPVDKIWVSVYEEDDEAYEIWEKKLNIPKERLVRLGKEDNFWEIGVGACGPCSEIHFDRGEEYGCDNPNCQPGCDCDRYLEFWNHVFAEFNKTEEGTYEELKNKNIDTGMGLERMACIMQNVDTIFEVDTIKHILDSVCKITNYIYGTDAKNDKSIRIITDHIRSVSFLVADGVLPSNEGRGYVLRRLLRRAARNAKLLGMKDSFLFTLVDEVIKVSGEAYPELVEKRDYIQKVIKIEEEKFNETIDNGTEILSSYIKELKDNNKDTLSGENAFKLYDTYGFPVDLTKEILEEENLKIDEDGFKSEMEHQRKTARDARANMDVDGWVEDAVSDLDKSIKSTFEGYEKLGLTGEVKALVYENNLVDEVSNGNCIVILDKTPFYPEGGGQAGDTGLLLNDNDEVVGTVIETKKGPNDTIKHFVELSKEIKVSDKLILEVSKEDRMASARNHTTTHILHKVLKDVLGDHVNQAGSLVNKDRLRFDVTHFEAITKEEISLIEKKVNDVILDAISLDSEVMNINDAKKKGAMALFGEKYGDSVRVVSIGDFSVELCGGTHLNNTSQVGMFKIISESGVASGVRRIEAITGKAVYEYLNSKEELINEVCKNLKTKEDSLSQRVLSLVDENKSIQKELKDLKTSMSLKSVESLVDTKVDVNGINLITAKFDGMDMNTLKEVCDNLRDKLSSGVVVLANVLEDKLNIVASASKDAVECGVHCGNIVKEISTIAGGKGGGRPNMAQAGAPDTTKADEVLDAVVNVLKSQKK
ncbi:MAG: alanine--tRNA ligase [Peptostreptococcaceae bacterium]